MTRSDGVGAFVPGTSCRAAPTARGPLDGLRFAVKDLIDIAGHVTGGGNPDWRRGHDAAKSSAPAVECLLAAGAELVGRTVSDELAFSLEGENVHDGTPLNPACPGRLAGGSSSGSAAAVAAGLCDFALGTDTGGSVRVPAGFCGLFGFRPTHGRVPLDGVIPFAPSYDTVGWFARDGRTLAAVGDVLLGAASRGVAAPARLLVARDAFALVDARCADELLRAAARLGAAEAVDIFRGEEAGFLEAYRVLQGAEVWRALGGWIGTAKPRFGEAIAARFADAAAIGPAEVGRWRPVRENIAGKLRERLPAGTALLLPTAPGAALPKGTRGAALGAFYQAALTLTSIAGHARLPQVTIPAAHLEGCPLGLSLVGGAGADASLLEFAAQVRHSPHG